MSEQKQMHIYLTKEQGAKYVFVPGSPERAGRIAKHFDNYKLIAQNREFTTYEGYLEGERVLVTSTGIGGPSAAICMEELHKVGADTFIRIGTCASLSQKVKYGDIVIPNGVIKMEGTSSHYVPVEFPAVPNYELVKHLETASNTLGYEPKIGVNITKASFYTQTEAELKPVGVELQNRWNSYIRGGAETTSMEEATLFSVASALGIRCASVLVSCTDADNSKKTNHYSLDIEAEVIKVGIEAMRNVIKADRAKNK